MTDPLPDRVRQWIREDGRSINALAEAAGLRQPTLQRFAAGQRDLTAEPLGKLLDALGAEIRLPKKRRKKATKKAKK